MCVCVCVRVQVYFVGQQCKKSRPNASLTNNHGAAPFGYILAPIARTIAPRSPARKVKGRLARWAQGRDPSALRMSPRRA
jgi:hypothetical protein